MLMSEYKNYLSEFGVSDEAANKRLDEIFNTLFYGSEEERIYKPVDPDMGIMIDTGNIDVRTEGMSYGMMMCVQLDKKEEFDRLWKWARTYMYMEDGPGKGYFAWSCKLNGEKNAYGAAPDGEEFFILDLIFAGNRWGNGEGIFNYHQEAKDLMHDVIRKGSDGKAGFPMFDSNTHYIKFVDAVNFTDPSYHLPHFYEIYAEYAYDEDKEFFREAAICSREYWNKCCHPVTGMSAEYAEYDGTPHNKDYEIFGGRHDWFYSDAYRTILNIALDSIWCGKREDSVKIANNLATFFNKAYEEGTWDNIFELDGTPLSEKVLHPIGLLATNATTAVLTEEGKPWLKRFKETPLRDGDRRYYDNCLYIFAYMLLSGNYRKY